MIESDESAMTASRSEGPSAPIEGLPYFVEMWDAGGQSVERVLARAESATLARAIFNFSRSEYPGRRVTLRHDRRILSDSAQ